MPKAARGSRRHLTSMPSEEVLGTYEGRYSDGRTASGLPVAVRLTPQGVEILPGEGRAPLIWPYGELAAAEPLGRTAGDVLVSCPAMPGATLFVADRNFVVVLGANAPQLTTGSQRWRI